MTSATACVFCTDECEDMDHYGGLGTEPRPSYLIARADGFRILSDNAPLVPGHVLVVPDEHVPSTALLSAPRLDRAAELVESLMAELAAGSAGNAMVFEHGTGAGPTDTGCCLAHAHLHVLPARVDVTGWFAEQGVPTIGSIATLRDLAQAGPAEYLFAQWFGDVGTQWDCRGLPSQLLRRLVGEALGVPLWNWHDRIVLQSGTERVAEISRSLTAARGPVNRLVRALAPAGG